MERTGVFLAGFGGPASSQDVIPFLESVLAGARVSPGRMAEVAEHYYEVGGGSPYNRNVFLQRAALEAWLAAKGRATTVVAGFRHAGPTFEDALSALADAGVRRAVAFVLSPLRSPASFGKYVARLDAALASIGLPITFEYAPAFHEDPYFIQAQTERAVNALEGFPLEHTHVLFSAHSIPVSMSDESGYASQFERLAYLVAERMGASSWSVAYQSRSGRPEDPWLGPDVSEAIHGIDRVRTPNVLVVPAGFVCENVEILFDLDVEAQRAAAKSGLRYLRSRTVDDHPLFIEAAGRLILWSSDSA